MEQFTYGDLVYDLYSNSQFIIETRGDYKFVNNNPNHFSKDKDYVENLKYEEI